MKLNHTSLLQRLLFIAIFIGTTPLASAAKDTINCEQALSNATTLNAYDIWHGAGDCSEKNKKMKTNFLLITGQIRAMTDMATLEPATEEDAKQASDLYGLLYSTTGGSGFDEVYQDNDQSKQLFNKLKTWSGSFDKQYNPGWTYNQALKPSAYDNMLSCQKALRINKLTQHAQLMLNQDYRDIRATLESFLVKNPGMLKEGTEANKRYQALAAKMKSISASVIKPQPQPDECGFLKKG